MRLSRRRRVASPRAWKKRSLLKRVGLVRGVPVRVGLALTGLQCGDFAGMAYLYALTNMLAIHIVALADMFLEAVEWQSKFWSRCGRSMGPVSYTHLRAHET